MRFVFFAAILGNILEYYDFTVYSVFVITIGKIFFPSFSASSQVLYSLMVFAIGFLTRPLGGIVFGYIGDKHGRKTALIYSMCGMMLSTITIGMVPGYDSIGHASSVILVIMRLIQGLCISGEGTGAAIFVLEHSNNNRSGFITSLVHASNIIGTLLASIVGIIIEQLYPNSQTAWRVAFIIGGGLGMIGLYLRLQVSETPIFKELVQNNITKSPIIIVFKSSWRYMLITFFLGAFASSVVYTIKTYIAVFFQSIMHMSHTTSLIYLAYTSFILMLFMPIFGALSDIFGRRRMIIFSSYLTILTMVPIFIMMSMQSYVIQIVSLTALGIVAASIAGVSYIFSLSLFSPDQRFLGVAFSYNLGIAIFGSTYPIFARWIVSVTQIPYFAAFYVVLIAAIFLCVTSILYKKVSN